MRHLSDIIRTLLGVLSLTSFALAASPELSIDASCDAVRVGTAQTVTVPVSFKAVGNAVANVDVGLTFPSDALVPTAVRVASRLVAAGWTVQWEGVLGLPLIAGQVNLSVAPPFQYPLPTLTDGVIAEVDFQIKGGGSRCVAISIPIERVVFSTPPVGQAIPADAGALHNGGIGVAEECENCADDDGDGLIDLADPDCGAQALTVKKLVVTRNPQSGAATAVRLVATLERVFPTLTGAAGIDLRPEAGGLASCAHMEAALVKTKGKKTKAFVLGGTGGSSLVLSGRQGKSTLRGTIKDPTLLAALVGLPAQGNLSVSLRVGGAAFHVSVPVKRSTKKVIVFQ